MTIVLLAILAHHYWVMPQTWSPEVGDTVWCIIQGGHDLQAPEIEISPKMVRSITVEDPDGTLDTLSPDLRFAFVPTKEGLYVIRVELGPRRLREPRYVLYTLLPLGSSASFRVPEEIGTASDPQNWPRRNQPLRLTLKVPTYATTLSWQGDEKTLKGQTLTITPKDSGPFLLSLEQVTPVLSLLFEVRP